MQTNNIVEMSDNVVMKRVLKGGVGINDRTRAMVDLYKPFIHTSYHKYFDELPKLLVNHDSQTSFVHFFIFAIWFSSVASFNIDNIHFNQLFVSFKHIPFHSFLWNIRTSQVGDS
jgi:hypothetical protein